MDYLLQTVYHINVVNSYPTQTFMLGGGKGNIMNKGIKYISF